MKTHAFLAALLTAGLILPVSAQEAAPEETGTAVTVSPEPEGAAAAAEATDEAAPEQKIDPEILRRATGDAPLPLIPHTDPAAAPVPVGAGGAGDETVLPEEEGMEAIAAPAAPLKNGSAEQLRRAIRIRQLKTVVKKDPALQRELAQARSATTLEGYRVAMRNYYSLLAAGIVKLAPDLAASVEAEAQEKLGRLEQRRVRPSQLIEAIRPLPGSRAADHAPAGPQ